jgi:hypothetical protein
VERTCGARDTNPIRGVVPSGRAGTRQQSPPSTIGRCFINRAPMHGRYDSLPREICGVSSKLKERISTDTAGIAMCLGLQADTNVELQTILDQIDAKLPQSTLLMVGGGPVPVPKVTDIEADERG